MPFDATVVATATEFQLDVAFAVRYTFRHFRVLEFYKLCLLGVKLSVFSDKHFRYVASVY
jgi:hypothetical protein